MTLSNRFTNALFLILGVPLLAWAIVGLSFSFFPNIVSDWNQIILCLIAGPALIRLAELNKRVSALEKKLDSESK